MCAQERGRDTGPGHTTGSGVESYPLKKGGVAGASAFIVGYITTYVLLVLDLEVFSDGVVDISWDGVGLVFYNAQFVRLDSGEAATTNSLAALARLSDTTVALDEPVVFDSGFLTVPMITYSVLVFLVLVGAGSLVARWSTPVQATVGDRMEAGATIVAGYLPLAFIGTFVFEHDGGVSGGLAVSPDVFAGVLVAGVLLPVVFGALGGYLSGR